MKDNDFAKFDLTALNRSFKEACSDEAFNKYIHSLKVEDDVLMKYTSSLEDSYQEYNHCLNCKGLESCKNKVSGFRYTPHEKGKVISFSYEACTKKNKEINDNAYKEKLDVFELNEDIKNASLKDVYKDDKARVPIIKYFKTFFDGYIKGDKPKGIYLYGSFGSGKTYLISALFNEMAKKGIRSTMVHYPRLLLLLKASFRDDYDNIFNYIMKSPLLLLDDIGAEKVSDWSRDEVLGIILQYRMENHLPTFFTSNLTLEELEKNLSLTSSGVDKVKAGRILDRIKQLTVYHELVSKNRRV